MVVVRASRGFERLQEAYERLREAYERLREASTGLQEASTEFHHRRVFHRDVLTVTGQSRYRQIAIDCCRLRQSCSRSLIAKLVETGRRV